MCAYVPRIGGFPHRGFVGIGELCQNVCKLSLLYGKEPMEGSQSTLQHKVVGMGWGVLMLTLRRPFADASLDLLCHLNPWSSVVSCGGIWPAAEPRCHAECSG